jgi:polyhydroxyalkanoate synthesis regulator phasin
MGGTMRLAFCFVVILLVSSPVLRAQMSVDEATRRMQERMAQDALQQQQEAAAATQPSNLSVGQVADLTKTIEQQDREIADLKKQVADLTAKLEATRYPGPITEARVGMTVADLNQVPDSKLTLNSEDTDWQYYKLDIGKVIDYGTQQVQDFPATPNRDAITHDEQVVVGSHPAKVQYIIMDAKTGKVVQVDSEEHHRDKK